MKYVPPSVRETAFNCPHCGVLTTQHWHSAAAKRYRTSKQLPHVLSAGRSELDLKEIKDPKRRKYLEEIADRLAQGFPFLETISATSYNLSIRNIFVSECFECERLSLWVHDNLLYPQRGEAPLANPDLSEDIRRDYDEASRILDLSPRGAAALLRLAIQKLCKELEPSGKDLNEAIKKLVTKGLDVHIQQALDVVRVTGNEAVHPGQIDLSDDKATAETLFNLVNVIAEKMISIPIHIGELYNALPADKLKQIEKRDGKSGDG